MSSKQGVSYNDRNEPLGVKEIYLQIVEKNLYVFKAEDPEHIVRTVLRRHSENINVKSSSKTKYFIFLKDGTFWFKDKSYQENNHKEKKPEKEMLPYKEITELQKKFNVIFKKNLLKQLGSVDPEDFEDFCRKLLVVYGFRNVKVTRKTRDGGIDGYGELKIGIATMEVAFECKRWAQTVGRPKVSQFRGDIQGKFQQGIFFTTSNFSKEAKDASLQMGAVPIILVDGHGIVELMMEKEFGVEKIELPIYSNALDLIFQK
ncbi:restriction endonuclease [Sphingobacterium phlebotomi]|uniref:Restriction endonuclease n=1 Tax=Sphingobacterium phlebotomi TaxID=2605433 RepID=A0A5D4H9M1_9SPHI|nr:restriction endonuclease [Sphingobacterium phlebotomi]TYR36155.1 restriction endonuclease [Sphingobacterium phlebotomi]